MGAADRLRRLPIRAKLTLAYTGAIAVLLGGIGLFLYLNFKSGLDTSLNTTLDTRADGIAAVVSQEGIDQLDRHRAVLAGDELAAQVLNPAGGVLFSTISGASPLVSPAIARTTTSSGRVIDRHERERFLVRRGPGGSTVIVVRASLHQRERALELVNGALLVGGVLTLLVAALAGYGLASAVLRPVEAMSEAASTISDVDPEARLPLPLAQDEVYRLGVTLNGMLARLERARDRERTFFSDASHELRTPLTILKAEVEIALRKDNPPETLRRALQVADAESDRLVNLAEDLLLIARSDSGALELERRHTPAHELLSSVQRRFVRRARQDGRSIVVDAGDDIVLDVDVRRVEQALTNLVENTLRHGDGRIELVAVPAGEQVELHVRDEGPGLPATFIQYAFERFSRAKTGRTGEGTGLGLAIVALVAEAHGGRARIGNRPRGGADAWLELPAVSSAGHVREQGTRL